MAHLRRRAPLLSPAVAAVVLALAVVAPASDARRLHRVNRVLGGGGRFDAAALCRKSAQHVKLCESLAASQALRSAQSLVEASVETAALKARHAQAAAARLMSAPDTEQVLKNILRSCLESYASTEDALQNARRLVRSGGRYADINSELSAAGTFVGTCQDSFDEFPGVDSPITHVQANLSKLVGNSLDLAATVLKN